MDLEGDQKGESDGNLSKGEEWAYKQEGETKSSEDKVALGQLLKINMNLLLWT